MIDRMGKEIAPDADLFTLGHMRAPAAEPGKTFADFDVATAWNSVRDQLLEIIKLGDKAPRELRNGVWKLINVNRDCTNGPPYCSLGGTPAPREVSDYYFFVLLVAEWKQRWERVAPGVYKRHNKFTAAGSGI